MPKIGDPPATQDLSEVFLAARRDQNQADLVAAVELDEPHEPEDPSDPHDGAQTLDEAAGLAPGQRRPAGTRAAAVWVVREPCKEGQAFIGKTYFEFYSE